jgi:hypothetical protein
MTETRRNSWLIFFAAMLMGALCSHSERQNNNIDVLIERVQALEEQMYMRETNTPQCP